MSALAGRELRSGLPRWHGIPLSIASRSVAAISRPVCKPTCLAPGPRSSRRQRGHLITRNFKQSENLPEESPVNKPKPARHPFTEDPYSGASPADTATQEAFSRLEPGGAAAKAIGVVQTTARAAREAAKPFARSPAATLRDFVRNTWLPLGIFGLAYFARDTLLGSLQSFWTFYNISLETHPLPTKLVTGIIGTIIGDFLAQKMDYDRVVREAQQRGDAWPAFTFDFARTARLAVFSALWGTPTGHYWFGFLDTHIFPEAPTSGMAVFSKVAIDQLLMSPVQTAILFFVMRCVGGHPHDAFQYTCKKVPEAVKAALCFWPLAQVINFKFVPAEQRILYVNAVGVVLTLILSTMPNEKSPPDTGAATARPTGSPSPAPVSGPGSPQSGGQPSIGGSPSGADSGLWRRRAPPPSPSDLVHGLGVASPQALHSAPDRNGSPLRFPHGRDAVVCHSSPDRNGSPLRGPHGRDTVQPRMLFKRSAEQDRSSGNV